MIGADPDWRLNVLILFYFFPFGKSLTSIVLSVALTDLMIGLAVVSGIASLLPGKDLFAFVPSAACAGFIIGLSVESLIP